MDGLIKEAKQFLSIVETSTFKDLEIRVLIEAGILELARAGINIEYNYEEDKTLNSVLPFKLKTQLTEQYITEKYDSLIKMAILFFVKANFGNTDVKEKEVAQRTFNSLEQSLALSCGYKLESDKL